MRKSSFKFRNVKDAFPRTYIFTVGGAVGVIAFVVLLGAIAFVVKIYKQSYSIR